LARAGTSLGTGLGRPLTLGEQAQAAGCSFDASGNILNTTCGSNVLDFIAFDPALGSYVTIQLAQPLPNLDDWQPTIVNGGTVLPTLDATGLSAAPVWSVISDGNVIEHVGVENAPLVAFNISGNGNTLYDIWTYAGKTGASLGGNGNLLKGSHIGAVNNGACWVNSAGMGVVVLGLNNKIDASEIACSDKAGIELKSNAFGTIISNDIIHDNAWDGIREWSGFNLNQWTQISTYNNGGLGVEKNTTAQQADQIDGPLPVVTSVSAQGGQITVSGTATASVLYLNQVELYVTAYDSSGYGEGKTYLGTANVNNVGQWTLTFPGAAPGCYSAIQGTKNQAGVVTSSEFGPNSCSIYLPLAIK
jgi:hypothetical protein